MYDPNSPFNPFGLMPEIPDINGHKCEPTEDDIAASHIVGCLYALGGLVVFFIGICLLSLIIYL